MSSLTTQLAQNASLNASLLVDRSRRKPAASYLFTGKDADGHDLEAIYALGANSLLSLSSIEPKLRSFEDDFFSDQAKETDRTLLTKERVAELDERIEEFLWLLGPYLMDPPTAKVLEWLVRRFRIHEFNVPETMALFLPYHESPHFVKMIAILQIKPNTLWSFLLPYKSAAQRLPRVSLVTEMLKDPDLARFVSSLLPTAIKKGVLHRTIIAFNAATLHDFIKRTKSISEGTLAHILPALLEPLHQTQRNTVKDAVLGSYVLLASLCQNCKISPAALQVVISEILSASHYVRTDQFVQTLVAVCGPQGALEKLPSKVVKGILGISDIQETLASAVSWVGSENIFRPLVCGLVPMLRKDESQVLLESIIATPTLPYSVMQSLTLQLIKIAVQPENESDKSSIARRLLSLIHQRYPSSLRAGADLLSEEDGSLKGALDQLVITLSTVRISSQPDNREGVDLIISSSSAEADVRAMAVKELVQSIVGKKAEDIEDLETVRSVLIARLQDNTPAVIEALYKNAAVVTPIFCGDPKSFVASLSQAFASQGKPKRNIIKLHLLYLTSHFLSATGPSTCDEIFHQVLFPLLLFTKPRQKTAELVWDLIGVQIVKAVESNALNWLEGCDSLVKTEMAKAEEIDVVELMNQINFSVSSKIAENILKSTHYSALVETVSMKLGDNDPHVRLLGYLIALALIKKSTGHIRVDIGEQILSSLGVEALAGVDDLSQEHLALEKSDDTMFGKYIVTKPNSKTTRCWMQIALVAAVARIPCPTGIPLNWLLESRKCGVEGRYVCLMRSVYQLANASTSLPVVSSAILRLLFLSLKDQTLAFLAGVWTSSDQELTGLKAVSLLHAGAFLEAHILEDDGVDFQTILPSVFVALHDSDARISQAALECISRIWILADRPLQLVYQFDVIYGPSNETLQYLDQEDLKRYMGGLVEHRDHLCSDPLYLAVFHGDYLGKLAGDKRRDADYKHRVICYLLSHANAFPSDLGQVALLKLTATVVDKGKIRILFPRINALVEKAASMSAADLFLTVSEELTIRLLASYDINAADTLNSDPDSWDVFIGLVRTFLRPGILLSVQKTIAQSLTNGLFFALNQHRQFALCSVLLEVGSSDDSTQSLARSSLSETLIDVSLIVKLLDALAPAIQASSPRAAKRVKTSETSEDSLRSLTLLAEVLGTKSLAGSLELTTHLLETLNRVVQSLPTTQADVTYIQQLLMSAIENTSSKIMEVPNISPNVIRIDVLVEVIRTSRNPQTFHQALLLIANLARLAPDSVLFNVMPVFTFMGSNVFHRDDSYSFKVVQETVDGIIPVMVSSLRESHSQALDLYIGAKDLLRVFTEAATHIPRHRRNSFFSHLVDVFGRRDFLPPICMLLLEKSANRVVRQAADDLQNTLALPITLFQQSDYEIQIHTATELLNEAQRLIAHINDPNSIQPTFTESMPEAEHSVSPLTLLKRRAQALIIFVGLAMKAKKPGEGGQSSISPLVTQFIVIATIDTNSSTKLDDILEAARLSLNRLLNTMSVVDFIDSVQSILASEDVKIQSGAFDVLAKRLPDVSARMRPNIKDNIKQILRLTKNFLHVNKKGGALTNAFQALKAIADNLCAGEEGSLADNVPYVLSSMNDKDLAPSSLSALASISVKLGPRIIPFFRQIISQCLAILREHDSTLFGNALSSLQGLLKTVPGFWGSAEVSQVILLYIDQPSASGASTLSKSLARKIPPKNLIPALLEMWNTLEGSKNTARISTFFDVFGRALQHADRPTVLEHLRDLFKMFLEALDAAKTHDEAEPRVIHAFREMVVKLTDSAFKPLFRRLHDWAFTGDIDPSRQTAFCHLYIHLLDFFKGLMVPYVSYLLQPLSNALDSFKSKENNTTLWSSVINVLTRTFSHDENGFWRDDKLRQLLSGLTNQVQVCSQFDSVEKKQLQDCFIAFLDIVTDDTLAKTFNLNILMHTRSESSRSRIFALSCSEIVWRAHGRKLLGFVTETATFIAECGEDENELVIGAASKLKDVVEAIAGKVDGL